jgi:hypothetical protein
MLHFPSTFFMPPTSDRPLLLHPPSLSTPLPLPTTLPSSSRRIPLPQPSHYVTSPTLSPPVAALLPWFQNTTEIWQSLGDCAGRHLGGIIRQSFVDCKVFLEGTGNRDRRNAWDLGLRFRMDSQNLFFVAPPPALWIMFTIPNNRCQKSKMKRLSVDHCPTDKPPSACLPCTSS